MEDNNKQIEIEELTDILGGTSNETKEVKQFISEHFPNVKFGNKTILDSFFRSVGISEVHSFSNSPNIYYDMEGHKLTHKEVMSLLQRKADHRG